MTAPVPCRADGTACVLPIDLYYPATMPADGGTYPVVVFEPGGADLPATSGSPLVPLLAGQGVVVIDASWRQSPQWGGGGERSLQDIACAILAARTLGPLVGGTPGSVTLIGHSLGGVYGSIVAFTPGGITPDPATCGFEDGSPAPDAFVGMAGIYDDAIALLDKHGLPSIPIILIHGDPDGSVPVEESRRLAAALTGAGRPTAVIVEPGAGHVGILTTPRTIDALLELLRRT
jgi:dipeptidyl aminopeptidase/acylaminoacyl peptidase